MKKITNILCIAGMGMMLFSACETDRDDNPTYHDASTFTLNEPENRVYDLGANDTIRLTLTQPDYGYTAATTYLPPTRYRSVLTRTSPRITTLPLALPIARLPSRSVRTR